VNSLRITKLAIPEVLPIETERYCDERGWFSVTYNQKACAEAGVTLCQENYSLSRAVGTVRGLHYQRPPKSQAKLIHVQSGRILDVALDLRKARQRSVAMLPLSCRPKTGGSFIFRAVLHAPDTIIGYKNDEYARDLEGGVAWNDPELGINWGNGSGAIVISDKDQNLPRLGEIESLFTTTSPIP
jgi:dTDP-4-dehydrorhamnose 3,5-epimerase